MSRRSTSESTTNSATKDNEEEEEEEEKKKNKPNSGASSSLFPEIEIVAPFNDHQMVDDVDNNNLNNNDDDDDDDDSSVHDREMVVVDEQEQASSSTAAPPLPSVAFFNHLLEEEDEETERQDDSSDPDHNDKDDDDDKSRRFSAPLPQSSSWGHACDTERWTNVATQRQGQGQGRRHGSEPLLPPPPTRQPLTHTTTYPPSSLSPPPPPPTAPPRCAPPPHHHHHPSLRRTNSSMAPRNVHVRRRQHWLKTLVPRPVANVVHWPSGVFGRGGGGGGGPCEEKEEENQEEKNLEEQDDHDQNNNNNEHDRPEDEYDYDDENMDHKNQEEQNKERDTNQNNNTDLDIIQQQQQHVLEAAELGMMMMMMMPGNDDEEEVGAPSSVKKNSIRKSSTKIADTVTPQYNLTNLRRYRQHDARRQHARRRHGRRQQAGGGRALLGWLFWPTNHRRQGRQRHPWFSSYYSYGAVACCGCNFNSLVVRYLLWSFRSSFGAVFLSAIVGFLALTLIFAAMLHGLAHYHPKCIGGVDYYNEPYFTDAFVLSWTTFSTVGYGVISSGTSANEPDIRNCTGITIVATLEAFVGILYAAFCSAIIFAKLSRTQSIAQVVFSTPLVIRYGSGVVIETNNLNNHHDSSTNHKSNNNNNNNNNNAKDRDDNNKEAELGAFMATATPADKNKINNNKKTSNSIFHRRRRRAGGDNETNKKKEFTKSGVADSQMTTKPCVADSQATSTSASKSARIKQVSDNSVADMRFLQDSQRLPCPILEFRIANRLCNVQGGELLDAAVNIVASIDAAQACHTIRAALQKRRRRKKRRGRAIRTSRAVTASLAVQHELEQHQKMDRDEYLSHAKELLSSSFAVSTPTTANAISQEKPPDFTKRFVRWKDASTSMPRRSSAKYSDRPSSSSTFLESQSDAASTTQGGGAKVHQPFDEDPTGHLVPRRIFSKLEVETFEHPFFQHVWTVRHVLDDKSPLLRSAAREMVQANGGFWPVELNSAQGVRSAVHFDQILVSLTGTSNADANVVYAQHVYEWVDLIVGYRFAKMLYRIGGRSGSSGVGTTSRIGHRPRNKNNKSKKKSKKNDDPHEDEHDDDIHGMDDDISDFHYDDYLDNDDDEDEPQWRVDLELLNDVTEQAGEDPGEPFPGAVKDTLGDHLANMLIL
ncbi:hypothetical protein ACA910_010209 [Epithemia clementina (nom. ined.)]